VSGAVRFDNGRSFAIVGKAGAESSEETLAHGQLLPGAKAKEKAGSDTLPAQSSVQS
jgi:hypothetical protein